MSEEDSIDPFMDEKDAEKLFNEDRYTTMILNTEEFSKKNKEKVANLVQLLSSGERESKDEALKILKEHEGKELLLEALALDEFKNSKAVVTAACWECGLDFTSYFEFFLYLVLSSPFAIAMEAMTVIENMEGSIKKELLDIGIEKLTEAISRKDEKVVLYEDLKMNLEARI